jgi:hypothetical protein
MSKVEFKSDWVVEGDRKYRNNALLDTRFCYIGGEMSMSMSSISINKDKDLVL